MEQAATQQFPRFTTAIVYAYERIETAVAGSVIGKVAKALLFIPSILFLMLAFAGDCFRWCLHSIGRTQKILAVLGIGLTGLFWYLHHFHVSIDDFGSGPLKAIMGCSLLFVVSHYGYPEVDTVAELKNGNSAVARHFQSYAIIIALALFSL